MSVGSSTPMTKAKEDSPIAQKRRETRAMRVLLPAALAIAAAVSLFARFHAGSGLLAFYDDDFSTMCASRSISSPAMAPPIDGVHMTNGYHPLWMLVLLALVRCFGAGTAFFCSLQVVLLLCVMLARTPCAPARSPSLRPRPRWLAQLIAAALATSMLMLASGGMEVALAIPLIAALVLLPPCRFSGCPDTPSFAACCGSDGCACAPRCGHPGHHPGGAGCTVGVRRFAARSAALRGRFFMRRVAGCRSISS